MREGVTMDQIESLVDRAHRLFGETSVFEVIDLPSRKEAIRTIVKFFGPVDVEKVDRYLDILDRLRREIGESETKNAD